MWKERECGKRGHHRHTRRRHDAWKSLRLHGFWLLACFCCAIVTAYGQTKDRTFYSLSKLDGLSDNEVLQMMQLPDGRLAVCTASCLNLYDGTRFRSFPLPQDSERETISGYHGFTHLYVDETDCIWIKSYQHVVCFDLKSLRWLPQPLQSKLRGVNHDQKSWSDVYLDARHHLYGVRKGEIVSASGQTYKLKGQWGVLQDLDVFGDQLLAFFSSGMVAVYQAANGRLQYTANAFDQAHQEAFAQTSLVVGAPDSCFYQIRTGNRGSAFLRFSPRTRSFDLIQTFDYTLHTLFVTQSRMAYISSVRGYLQFDISQKEPKAVQREKLRLPDGSMMVTGVNTVCLDREGGIWMGTYNRGLLYASPLASLFDTRTSAPALTPVLLAVYLHGQILEPNRSYEGKTPLQCDAPYANDFIFSHSENDIAFQLSGLNFVRPRFTHYRYRLNGEAWREVSASDGGNMVDDNGRFYISFVHLRPGNYELDVQVSADGKEWKGGLRQIRFEVQSPWWATIWAISAYILIGALLVLLAVKLYVRRMRKRLTVRYREKLLMERIYDLVERNLELERSARIILSPNAEENTEEEPFTAETGTKGNIQEEARLSQADHDLMVRATQLVEQHLADRSYGVEQLASDLCMERTGLYRKLTTIMAASPVVFMKQVRLHRAADLLRSGQHSLSDIATQTGFSSVSYFSKCFQREFGVRPSEYAQNEENK